MVLIVKSDPFLLVVEFRHILTLATFLMKTRSIGLVWVQHRLSFRQNSLNANVSPVRYTNLEAIPTLVVLCIILTGGHSAGQRAEVGQPVNRQSLRPPPPPVEPLGSS